MIDLAAPLDPGLREVLTPAEAFSIYAVAMRYPGAPYEPDDAETEAAIDIADAVFQALLLRMPQSF